MTEQTEKDKQIAFLKEHEEEMTKYVKKETSNISKVTYDWNSAKEVIIGNGLPSGAGKNIQLFGYVNDNQTLDFRIDIKLNKQNMPDMSTVHYGQALNIKGE